jgi:hypothetical protein
MLNLKDGIQVTYALQLISFRIISADNLLLDET